MTGEKPISEKELKLFREALLSYFDKTDTSFTLGTDHSTYTLDFKTPVTFTSEPVIGKTMSATMTTPTASKTDIENNEILWKMYNRFVCNPNFRVGYVWGPPGVGKTYGAQRLGLDVKKGSRKVYCVTLTEETPSAELRGHYVPKGGEFFWHDGPMARAMREGARIVINEVSHASPDCLSFFYAALESPETAVITLPTGEDIRPNPGFQVILTDNVPPSHLPAPLQDRLDASFEVKGPSPEALTTFPEPLRNIVLATALSEPSKRISLRSWETINRLAEGGMDIDDAGIIVLKNKWVNVKASVVASRITKK